MVGVVIVTVLPLLYAAVASYFILVPTDSTIQGSGVSRLTYELTQFIPLGIILVLTVVFSVWGQMEKRNQDVLVEVNLEAETEAMVSASD